MKIPIESSKKKSEYSVYVYGALDVRLFPNKRLNVDLKNIEIWLSHGLIEEEGRTSATGFASIGRVFLSLSWVFCRCCVRKFLGGCGKDGRDTRPVGCKFFRGIWVRGG